MSLGRIGHPHPLQGVLSTLHKVQRDLVAEEEGPWSLVTQWVLGSRYLPLGTGPAVSASRPSIAVLRVLPEPRNCPEQVDSVSPCPRGALEHLGSSRTEVWQSVRSLPRGSTPPP